MTKRDVFIDLLSEFYSRKELESDRSQETLKRLHNEYDKWVNKYERAK